VEQLRTKLEAKKSKSEDKDEDEKQIDKQNDILIVERFGSILRKSTQRLTNLFIDSTERILVCDAKESFIECFKLKTEVKKSFEKRAKASLWF
jgi:hypothetical protein